MNRRKFIKAISGMAALAVPAGLAANAAFHRAPNVPTQADVQAGPKLTVEQIREVVARLKDDSAATVWGSHYIAMGRPVKVARMKSTRVMPPPGRWAS